MEILYQCSAPKMNPFYISIPFHISIRMKTLRVSGINYYFNSFIFSIMANNLFLKQQKLLFTPHQRLNSCFSCGFHIYSCSTSIVTKPCSDVFLFVGNYKCNTKLSTVFCPILIHSQFTHLFVAQLMSFIIVMLFKIFPKAKFHYL